MKRMTKRSWALALVLALILSLCACGSNASSGSSSSTASSKSAESSTASSDSSAASSSESTPSDVSSEEESASSETSSSETPKESLFGSPWVTSMMTGNLPETAPEAKDDFYTSVNYEELKEHQGGLYAKMMLNPGLVNQTALAAALVEDKKGTEGAYTAYTDRELEQLRIFASQAGDLETLKAQGISELKPFLDKVSSAATLSELSEVLLSDDFPFCPFLYFLIGTNDMRGENKVAIYPEFIFVDNLEGSQYLRDSDDPAVSQANQSSMMQSLMTALCNLTLLGEGQETAQETIQEILAFEKSYGKLAPYSYLYQDMEYGALSTSYEELTMEDLKALCPDFPIEETLKKFGKTASSGFIVGEKEWLAALNDNWKEENLDLLKKVISLKILQECSNYLDPSVYDSVNAMQGLPAATAESNMQKACEQPQTFGMLLGNIFVTDTCSKKDIDRLREISEDQLASLRSLIEKTSWLSDSSREKVLLKIDAMRLNILIPDGGYTDYSDLELTPSKEGGTLVGNYLKIKKYLNEKANALIGQKALSRLVWEHFSPGTVNCFYDPDSNSINILPGYTAMIGYTSDSSEEQLQGTIGWVIAHEINHGFDFLGSQKDAYGRSESIFEKEDVDAFLEKVGAVTEYFSTLEPFPGYKVNGKMVQTEAAADLNGFQVLLGTVKDIEDFDYKEFFENCARMYLMVLPDMTTLKYIVSTDGHPLNSHRVNVNIQMFDEFYETYGVKEGDGMYLSPEKRIHFFGE